MTKTEIKVVKAFLKAQGRFLAARDAVERTRGWVDGPRKASARAKLVEAEHECNDASASLYCYLGTPTT